jgi:DNA topoisomerase-1
LAFADIRLARLITRCQGLAGQTLFSYEKADGGSASIKSTDVNDYLADTTGMPFTAKDFRTWGASAVVTEELAEDSRTAASAPILEAIDVAAERLGNSRAICRDSYVHPRVLEAFERGDLGALWRRARPGKWIDRSESALRMLLEDHQ